MSGNFCARVKVDFNTFNLEIVVTEGLVVSYFTLVFILLFKIWLYHDCIVWFIQSCIYDLDFLFKKIQKINTKNGQLCTTLMISELSHFLLLMLDVPLQV